MSQTTEWSRRQRAVQIGLVLLVSVLITIAVALFLSLPRGGGTAEASVSLSPTPRPSASSSVPQPTLTAAASASVASDAPTANPATPTPQPVEPAVLNPGDWAEVATTLNLRPEPGLDGGVRARLEDGDLLLVQEGPTLNDGYSWYRVLTLAGGAGWIASGPREAPFVADLSSEQLLSTCGRVEFGSVIAGRRFAWALDDLEQSLLALIASTEGNGCINLVASDNEIRSFIDAGVDACGEPLQKDDGFWVLPSVARAVAPDWQVKHTVFVEPLLSAYAALDEQGWSNRDAVAGLAADADVPFACVSARITDTTSSRDFYIDMQSDACYIVDEISPQTVLLRARPAGTDFHLLSPSIYDPESIPTGIPTYINVTATYETPSGEVAGITQLAGDCGTNGGMAN